MSKLFRVMVLFVFGFLMVTMTNCQGKPLGRNPRNMRIVTKTR